MEILREEGYPENLETALRLFLSDSMVERVDRILLAAKNRLLEQLQSHTPALCPPLTLPWSLKEMRLVLLVRMSWWLLPLLTGVATPTTCAMREHHVAEKPKNVPL